jgi:hypothetical protein
MNLHAIHDLFGLQVSRVKREDSDILPKLNELMSNILGISAQPTHNLRRILPNEEPNSQLGSLTGLLHINELKELSVANPTRISDFYFEGTVVPSRHDHQFASGASSAQKALLNKNARRDCVTA